MKYAALTIVLITLTTCAAVCPADGEVRVLLVTGERGSGNYTAIGLNALGIKHKRISPAQFNGISMFDYDLVIWGYDNSRSQLEIDPVAIDKFVRDGGVVLGFRRRNPVSSLPSPVKREAAYAFGKILKPEHPIFNTPHKITRGGAVYGAFCDLGKGWIPLASTGKQAGWDKTKPQYKGAHYGIVELPRGRGRIVLLRMKPAIGWFKGHKGDRNCTEAKLFENLLRYAIGKAQARAKSRSVPAGFYNYLADVMTTPKRGDGIPMGTSEWKSTVKGPYTMEVDRRGVLTFTHPDAPSRAGNFIEVSRSIDIPAGAKDVTLQWYKSDTYCGGRERRFSGKERGTRPKNFKKDMRYAQVLVNGKVIWRRDVLGHNLRPSRRLVRWADITKAVREAGGKCKVTLRLEDIRGSGKAPFAIDAFWAVVDVIYDMVRKPAAEAFESESFKTDAGSLILSSGEGTAVHRFKGSSGRYAIALRLRDEAGGQSTMRILAGSEIIAQWKLTANDQRTYWAVTKPIQLATGTPLKVEAACEGNERVCIEELAIIPASRLATAVTKKKPPRPATARTTQYVKFPITVHETAGVARENEIAVQGLPFPRGCLKNADMLQITDASGKVVPVQTRVIAKWSDGSIKVALVCFPATVTANGQKIFTVEAGKILKRSPKIGPLSVTEKNGLLHVDTGVITATISTTYGRIVEEVRRGGKILKPAADIWELAAENADGRVVRSGGATVTETRIIDRGPLRALIVRKGSFADDKGKYLDYRMTIEATAGSDALRMETTIINRENARQTYIKRWSMRLEGKGLTDRRVWLDKDTSFPVGPKAVLYQHREDTLTWTGVEGKRTWAKSKAPGYVSLGNVAIGLRWFWQKFPQAIRFSPDAVRFDFIPQAYDKRDLPTRWRDRMNKATNNRYKIGGVGYPQTPGIIGLFRMACGEALSQEILFVFNGVRADGDVKKTFSPLTARLRAVAKPSYTAGMKAFGQFHPTDTLRYPRYEKSVDQLYEGMLAQRKERREYGLENFGDNTFEWGFDVKYTFWSNSEYDQHHGLALQYLRSGDPKWWGLCEQRARHYRDVVVIHHGGRRGAPWHHSCGLWMPQHKDQYWIADHTRSSQSPDHSWVEGLIDYWFLTGDPWTEEVIREMGGWYCNVVKNNRYNLGRDERGPGWTLISLSALTEAMQEERFRKTGWTVVNDILDIQDPIRGVVGAPIYDQPSYEGGITFMSGVLARGLGRWYDITGDERVKQAIIGIEQWATTEPMGRIGRFWYKQSPRCSRFRDGNGTQSLTGFGYAWQLSGDPWFARVALKVVRQSGVGRSSLSWWPQGLAQLAPLLTPADVILTTDNLTVAPGQGRKIILKVRNTVQQPVTVSISARAPKPFAVTVPDKIIIPAGQAKILKIDLNTNSFPAANTMTLQVKLSQDGEKEVSRNFTVKIKAIKKLVRIETTAAEATLTAPMVRVGAGNEAYAHTPRGSAAKYALKPRPKDGKSGGYIVWVLDVPVEDDYRLLAEVNWLDAAGNSFFAGFDEGDEVTIGNYGDSQKWIWIEGPEVRLKAGKHTIKIRTREDGAKIRRIRLSNY